MGFCEQGGCHCGKIRFEVTNIFDAGYCHCSICRKTSGAPVTAWALMSLEDFKLLKGTPKTYSALKGGIRYFCPDCGSQMYFESRDQKYISLSIGCLDHPEKVRPTAHVCTSSQLPWFKIHDDLPRSIDNVLSHPDNRPSPIVSLDQSGRQL